jgi:hypothetical protein
MKRAAETNLDAEERAMKSARTASDAFKPVRQKQAPEVVITRADKWMKKKDAPPKSSLSPPVVVKKPAPHVTNVNRNDAEYYSPQLDDPAFYAKCVATVEHLKTHGWAVWDGFLDAAEIEANTAKMWDTLEAMSAKYKPVGEHFTRERQSYASYHMDKLLPHKHGIVETAYINHAEAVRDIRTHDKVLRFFTTLYGTTQLVGSMDRVNFKFPGRRYKSQADWPHADQQPGKNGLRCVQAYVSLTGSETEEHPGNRFYDKSHLAFEQMTRPFVGLVEKDWFKLTPEQIAAIDTDAYPLVKPCHGPGALVLWDSRTIHSPSDGSNFAPGRYVVYACYQPYNRVMFTAADEKKKRELFTQKRAAPHWPSPQATPFPEFPRTYDREDFRYRSADDEHLFAPALKQCRTKEERRVRLAACQLPNEREKLVFGFESYSTRGTKGLWDKKWGGGAPLLTLVADREKVPLNKTALAKLKKAKQEKKAKQQQQRQQGKKTRK